MADNIINTRIQQRYDSFDNWKNQNPILLTGEVVNVRFADGTVRIKTGNGTSAFNSLPWDDKNLYQGNSSTVSIPDSSVSWGGENREKSFGPIDAAMVSELGANRFAFILAKAIEVEYSKDGGTTWLDYGATDGQKISCFSSLGTTFIAGKSSNDNPATENDQLRITLTQSKANLYTQFNKFVFLISTNGSSGCKVTIQGLLGKNLTDDTAYQTIAENIPIGGWSGYNVINNLSSNVIFGPNDSQYGKLRFVFTNEGHDSLNSSNAGLIVHSICGFGGVGWITPSNLAKFGHLYSWNAWKDAIFPNNVKTEIAPTSSNDLTNKKYVDEKVASIDSVSKDYVDDKINSLTILHTQISDFDTSIQRKFAYRMFKNLIGKNYLDESTIQDGYYGSSASDWNTYSAEAGVKCVAIELDAGTYTVSCSIDNTTAKFIRWAASGTVNVISGQPASFTFTLTKKDKVYITWKSANSTYENMKTMIELGLTATTYEPYIPVPGSASSTSSASYSFLTPEQFGAKGDGVTNDLEALNQCIEQAKDSLAPIYGFGYYYIGTSTLNLHMNDVTFFANMIKSDSTDCAVNLQGKNNIIIINSIRSKGNGFVVTTSPDRPLSLSNYIFLKYIQATNHCFYKYSHDNSVRITYNTFNFLNLGSSTGDCIRDYGGGGNNTYHGNNVYCYAENGYGLNLKGVSLSTFDAFVFENDVKYGILCDGSSQNTFTNIRSRELADRMKDNNDIYVIEFKGESYGNRFESRCDYIAVKNNISAFNATKANNVNELNYWDDCLRFNGANTLKLDRLIPYSYPSSDAALVYRPWTGTGEIVTYYNHTGIKLDHDVYYNVTETTFNPYDTNAYVPTVFNIKENTTITLNDMYFPMGIDKITIVQTDGKKAKVIDRHGNTIFDGTNKDNGVYTLRCITEENDTTTQFHGDCFCFTGENDEWIEETLIASDANLNIADVVYNMYAMGDNNTVTGTASPVKQSNGDWYLKSTDYKFIANLFSVGDKINVTLWGDSGANIYITANGNTTTTTSIAAADGINISTTLTAPLKIESTFQTGVYIRNNEPKHSGLMSAEDKSNLNNLQTQIGDISTALDSILAIQNNLLGGNS